MKKALKVLLGLVALIAVLSVVGFLINVAVGILIFAIKAAIVLGVAYITFKFGKKVYEKMKK